MALLKKDVKIIRMYNWRERLLEETKKDILKEAREKAQTIRYSQKLQQSLDSDEKLSRIQRLQELQRNYDILQLELLNRSPQISVPSKKAPSKSPDIIDSFTVSNGNSDKISSIQPHLDQMQLLQQRAKKILEKERLASMATVPEEPILNEKLLRKKRQERVHLKIPTYVTSSSIRKEKKLMPNLVNRVLPNGEVMPVYVVGDPIPAYDPLVKVYSLIQNQNAGFGYRDSVDATGHSQQNSSIDSVFYYRVLKKQRKNAKMENFTPEPCGNLTEMPKTKEQRPLKAFTEAEMG